LSKDVRASAYNLKNPPKLATMDTDLKKILAELPIKPPRSRLEPYREFIEELRSRGRTYRDIAEILAEKCSLQVTASGVHDFVRTRTRAKDRSAGRGTKSSPLPVIKPLAAGTSPASASSEQAQRKIAALKARNTTGEPGPPAFEYDPDQPLRLKR
jgi:hypothetical protein